MVSAEEQLARGQDDADEGLTPRDYLFVAIDDYSRELYAAILPDKTAASAGSFLGQVLEECAYTIETAYTDNGKEFQGNPEHHAFAELCMRKGIGQKFTRPAIPKTNGKTISIDTPCVTQEPIFAIIFT